MSEIYNGNNASTLLGILLNDVEKCLDSKYPLEKNDFKPVLIHKILFATIYNFATHGVKELDAMQIEEFLSNYPDQKAVYDDNNGSSFIDMIKELAENKVENIQWYWEDIRKHSILREYDKRDYPIKKIWDKDKSDEENERKLNECSIDDIINYFEKEQLEIRKKYANNKVKEEYVAGTDFNEYKERFKEEPLIGNSFQSEHINAVFRGMFGFILRVAKTGGGKTAMSVGDICKTCAKEYWDFDKKKFVRNKSRVGTGLFINTEMELREELDPMFIAWISGVDKSHIIDGRYFEGEEDRVDYANEILLDSGIYFVDDPDFTTKSLRDTIKEYTMKYDVQTVCFDYIQNNSFVAKEISNETKIPQREDMVLLELTARLKQVQRECGISLISSVQTNGQEDQMEYPTDAVLAGGKSQARKTNGTMCMLPPTKKELEATSLMLNKKGFGQDPYYINNVVHIIKGRGSKYPKNTKIFQHIDLGTMRSIDLYCTDKNNNPIKVEPLTIEYDEE